jgi:hypothetical protein
MRGLRRSASIGLTAFYLQIRLPDSRSAARVAAAWEQGCVPGQRPVAAVGLRSCEMSCLAACPATYARGTVGAISEVLPDVARSLIEILAVRLEASVEPSLPVRTGYLACPGSATIQRAVYGALGLGVSNAENAHCVGADDCPSCSGVCRCPWEFKRGLGPTCPIARERLVDPLGRRS